jgi:hypothetical protein
MTSGGEHTEGSWTEVYVTYDTLEAEMIKDLLESGEIPVVLRSSKVSPYPVNVGKIGEVKILVREEHREIAERVIREEIDSETPGDAGNSAQDPSSQ